MTASELDPGGVDSGLGGLMHEARAPLDPTICEVGAEELARRLLGCHLISLVGGTPTGGRIVETEAYVGPDDPACHAASRVGRTQRNAPMFGPAGRAYVYFVYGMHWCLNVVAGRPGDPQAVLIRAIEPRMGLARIVARRGRSRDLTNGPARLCQALAIDASLNEHPLWTPPLSLVAGAPESGERVTVSGRIGIREACDWPLRFFIEGHPDVSKARARKPPAPFRAAAPNSELDPRVARASRPQSADADPSRFRCSR